MLVDNINFASAEFIAYQTKYVQEKYFEKEVGTESDNFDRLAEEIFAYITGDIHNGDPNGEVHKFIRDYDAVKTAWDDLIKKQTSSIDAKKEHTAEVNDAVSTKAHTKSKEAEVYFQDGQTVIKFDEHTGKYDDKRMAAVYTAKFLSKLGIGGKYYFYESYLKDGVRVYKDTNGNEVEAPNGMYQDSDGSIYIDLNAGNVGQGTVLYTMAHELLHFVRARSEKQFKILCDLVTEAYGKTDMSMHERVLAKQKFLSDKRSEPVSYNEAHEEVVADAMSTMLSDGSFFEKLLEIKAKDKGLCNTIKRFFERMISKFRKAYEGLTPEQQDAQDIRAVKDMFDKIQTAFAEALVEASDNFQADKAQKNTTEDGGVENVKDSVRRTKSMTLKEQLSAYYEGNFKQSDSFYFGQTPSTLSRSGLDVLPLAFSQDDFVKSTRTKHNIPRRVLKNLNKSISEPLFSFSAGKQIAVMTKEIDGDGKPVVVAIHGGHTMDRRPINVIKSVYGVDSVGEWVKQQIDGGSKFCVYDIEKASAMLQTQGYLAAVGAQSDGSWDNISETNPSVNKNSDRDYIAAVNSGNVVPLSQRFDASQDDIRYSYRGTNKDGIEVYETSPVILSLSWQDRKAKYLDVMRNDYRGRTARFSRNGHIYYAQFDQSSIRKHIYGDKRSSPDGVKALIKAGADGDVFDLVENSQYSGSLRNSKNHTKADYFDYFVKTVQIDGKVFDLVADVEKIYSDPGGYVYTLALVDNKKIKASPALGTPTSGPVKGAGNASTNKVAQNGANVNKNSERGEGTSNRDLLANALESVTKDSDEYKLIQEYKGRIRLLNEQEEKLAKLNAEIRKITFGTEGERDYKKLSELQAKAKDTAKLINKQDKKLLSLEATEPLKKIIEQERKKEAQKTKEHIKEIQQNKKTRAELTELRHKIRKTIRDLNKILNRGNKKQNVKEGLQDVVSKALAAADVLFTDHYGTYDMLRNGIGTSLGNFNSENAEKSLIFL